MPTNNPSPSFFQRLRAAFTRPASQTESKYQKELHNLQATIEALHDLRRTMLSPQYIGQHIESLLETDSRLVDMLLQARNWTVLGGDSYSLESIWSETNRRLEVGAARWAYYRDLMIARIVQMWTDFGFGQHVAIEPNDETMNAVFDEFWKARRNRAVLSQRRIHDLSNTLVIDGEFFFVFYVSTLDGTCTVRTFTTDQFNELICDPDDPTTVIYYVQQTQTGRVLYQDWEADDPDPALVKEGDKLADTLRDNTIVRVIPVQQFVMNKRGWPTLRRVIAWATAYKEFLENRATVASSVAMFVDKLKVKGGERAVEDVIARLQSSFAVSDSGLDRNPPPSAGSSWVENEAITRSRLSQATGAGDAQMDGMSLAGQVSAGGGPPLHWLGRPDAMQNQAVARESAIPWFEQMQRYQSFWISVWADVVEFVGRMAALYGEGQSITDYSAEIYLDSPFVNDIQDLTRAVDSITTAADKQSIDRLTASRAIERLIELILNSFGVQDAYALLYPEAGPQAGEPVPDENSQPEDVAAREFERNLARANMILAQMRSRIVAVQSTKEATNGQSRH